ncbi:MAG: anthranilate phosphoribosyltransferase [Bacteroidales bacterium]|nr:anthranilate phosphoribosyltransferase [Bacteroidales bacterium]
MRKILNYLFEHKTLSRAEAQEVLTNIARGTYSDSEIAAFISVYLMRSITVDELAGFRDALLNHCIRIDLSGFETMDVCGTGGDNKDTFNISTLSTFILAGAGVNVAKHGNYGVSSVCGSSNILEYFGYKFSSDRDKLCKEMEGSGVCFLHAPLFNPAMKNVSPVRRSLKIKTFFNMLGPMVNPAFPDKQLIGVYSLELARLYNYLFQQSGKESVIVHSLDGYDEVSLTSEIKFILNGKEQFLTPEQLGYRRLHPDELKGGKTVAESAGLFMRILQGEGTAAQNDVAVVNSQMALKCYDPSMSMEDCKNLARESLISKKALTSFKKLIEQQS